MTGITIFNSVVYYSLYFTQVISGILMISTIPVMIILISSVLKIEKTNNFQIIGVILSLVGGWVLNNFPTPSLEKAFIGSEINN